MSPTRAPGQVWIDPARPERTFLLDCPPSADGEQTYIDEHGARGYLPPEDFEGLVFSPSLTLAAIADHLDALPPGSAPPRDTLTMAHAAGVLRRLAPRVASEDPATVARAVGQIRSMRWSGPSAPAALWGEAVEAVAGMGGAEAAPSPMDPRAALQRALEEAYRRGVGDGTAAERGRAINIAQIWEDDRARGIEVLIADDAFKVGMDLPADLGERVARMVSERAAGAGLATEVEKSGDET